MSLAALVNGADCGPVNPLQGLTKNLESDRGLQQDHFGANRAGSSRGAFRTAQATAPGFGEDARHFFDATQSASPLPPVAQSPFDLAALRTSLPAPPIDLSRAFPHSQSFSSQVPNSSWVTDFLVHASKPSAINSVQTATSQQGYSARDQVDPFSRSHVLQPQLPTRTISQMSTFNPLSQATSLHPNFLSVAQIDKNQLEDAFQSLEQGHTSVTSENESKAELQPTSQPQEADLLARTAGLLVQSVDHERNPKFANSQFLGLMKQLRDRTAIVEGNDIVAAPSDWQMEQGYTVSTDPKGKGKAVSFSTAMHEDVASQLQALSSTEQDVPTESEVDANEAYFRQDNEDYANYWKAHHGPVPPVAVSTQEWQQLQRDWERFEATTTGIMSLSEYQFQPGNPYLLGERSHNHDMHSGTLQRRSFSESVLHMEAAVQRDPTNALAWYELGVRQQENEREQQAISALRRALELDPTHLPSWLALAISYTNEGDRHGTYKAVQNWVRHNEKYRDIVTAIETHDGAGSDGVDEFQKLIGCLIAMARGVSQPGTSNAELDADVQIALAVLLNTNEDYGRAQDCFGAALSVRPDDWLLYNRVGATLANGGRAEEALSYYYKALEINPAYIRARFNLGISCINLKRFEEAGQHILDALVLQGSDGLSESESGDKHGVVSSALWDSLKTCCLHMHRIDLASMCDRQDLEGPS
ncbi:hypothetical protein B0F90DRAFT_1698015 [Multifurca ochricompacta]|uniref:Peroxisomal targeting signal 1 receptor n=1 Tax=Multifurca ochricompacta TaxID=376703 RepID=A0AAD4MA62_9AGAM|nr:hypothetical protein B0F90DRAFT_1698015 [Multifurca ochricompacta]